MRAIAILLCASLGAIAADEALPRVRPAEWAQPMVGALVENLHRLDDGLYRSAQPSAAAMRQLEQFGIRSVLNLRDWHDDGDEVKGTALKRLDLPLEAGSLTEADLVKALRLIRQAEKPVLVHCWHGADRTGAVIAAWRVCEQGWDPAKAAEEMVAGGFGHHAGVYPEIERLVRGLDRARLLSALAAP